MNGDGAAPSARPLEALQARIGRYGRETTSFQTVEPGLSYWFEGDGDACVAYADTGGAWVSVGPPLAPAAREDEVALRFVEEGRRAGRRVCFFGVERDDFGGAALARLHIGEQPFWDPQGWPEVLRKKRSLREQLRRARAKGVSVRCLSRDELADRSGRARREIDALIARWKDSREMAPMGFVVSIDLDTLVENRRVFVAEKEGRVVGVLAAVPIPAWAATGGGGDGESDAGTLGGGGEESDAGTLGGGGEESDAGTLGGGGEEGDAETLGGGEESDAGTRGGGDGDLERGAGWFFEDVLRRPEAPNGTIELLFDQAMRYMAARGCRYVTYGLAPLAHTPSPLLRWIRDHTRWLYHFDGLRAFKAKLLPDGWRSVYLAHPRDPAHAARWRAPVRIVCAVLDALSAFAGGSFVRFGLATLRHRAARVTRVLALLLVPWTAAMAVTEGARWFPSPTVKAAWIGYDVVLFGLLLALARRWHKRLAVGLALAAAVDFLLGSAQAGLYNLPRARGPLDWVVAVLALGAPLFAAVFLWCSRDRARLYADP